ncbi:unnamed protein product [Polarella glacialis]|uniref:Uncharacterized protein n=1 Tax=Polarella glacialis TaxID=89957 RepID=A0A813GBV1_POLGL|nr:unnamed protein product [Polarella glacialis]CAE8708076.1 unnamed protein product [Polarella glacialis]
MGAASSQALREAHLTRALGALGVCSAAAQAQAQAQARPLGRGAPRPLLRADEGPPADKAPTQGLEEGSKCEECVRKAARVFCGGEHTLLRDPSTLELYQLGACGLGFDHASAGSTHCPGAYTRKVPLPAPASAVFPGYYHNFVKLVGGRCVSYGCGRQAPNDGQLMNGSLKESTEPVATQVRFAEAVAGGHHSVCRTRDGEVWVAGAGWQGQMGDGGLKYANPAPQRVAGLPRIQQLASGYYHSAALAEDGEWYVWGCNEQGQLAPNSLDEVQLKQPRRLSSLLPELEDAKIASVEGGYGHTVLLLADGRVFSLGNHSEGQRAVDPELEEAPGMSAVSLPGPAEAVAAGSHHTLAIVGGAIYSFGSNEFGQVKGSGEPGEEENQRVWAPHAVHLPVSNDPVVRVSAGICHSAAQTASGRVFLWGCGGNGQTGDASLPSSSAIREVRLEDVMRRCAT